jgi:hypothetical protein
VPLSKLVHQHCEVLRNALTANAGVESLGENRNAPLNDTNEEVFANLSDGCTTALALKPIFDYPLRNEFRGLITNEQHASELRTGSETKSASGKQSG